jgi:hypothetical protein
MRGQGDREDRRQRRERAVDEANQRGLRALQEKASLVERHARSGSSSALAPPIASPDRAKAIGGDWAG